MLCCIYKIHVKTRSWYNDEWNIVSVCRVHAIYRDKILSKENCKPLPRVPTPQEKPTKLTGDQPTLESLSRTIRIERYIAAGWKIHEPTPPRSFLSHQILTWNDGSFDGITRIWVRTHIFTRTPMLSAITTHMTRGS